MSSCDHHDISTIINNKIIDNEVILTILLIDHQEFATVVSNNVVASSEQ